MSLNRIVGVGKIQDPEVKKVARTAQQYRQMVHNIKYKLRLAQGKNISLQKIAKQQFVDNVDELLISRGTRLLLKGELKNFKKKPRARKWTLEDKLFALAIYKRSPWAYRFLIQHVTLPSEGTLKNLLNDIPLEVGILKSVLTLLKSNAQKMKPSERHCVLRFDEVYLVPHLKFSKKKKNVSGFENYGHRGQTHLVADHALVFLLQGLQKKWTQPVAFFYVHKTCPSSMLRLLITDVVRAVRETGLNVLATVSDQGPTNRGAVAELKANSTNDDIFYSVDNVKMVHIYDIPHIFKNIRNNLLSSDLEYEPGKIAKWANIIEYFKLDESICSTSRLTYKHMNPQGKEKMKVKFAAETISQKVAEGMKTIHVVSDGRKLPTCVDTSSFLLIADNFFDLTNGASSSPAEQKKFTRSNVSNDSLHHKEWPLMIKHLQNWTYIRKTTGERHVPPCVKGWVQSVKGIMWLWSHLKSDSAPIRSLNLRHLNQDALDNMFGTLRQCCGSTSDMTVIQFKAALKTFIVTNLTGKVVNKNCMDDDSYILNDMHCLLSRVDSDSSIAVPQQQQSLLHALQPLPVEIDSRLHEIRVQAPAFISSTLVSNILNNMSCNDCQSVLTTNNTESYHLNFALSASHYALKKDCTHYASVQVTNMFVKCQEIFEKEWKRNLHTENVVPQLIEKFQNAVDWSFLSCEVHASEVKEHLLQKICICLLERKVKMINTNRKKSIFKRTRQTLHSAIKNIDGLTEEEEDHHLHCSDINLLNELHPQPVLTQQTPSRKGVFQTPAKIKPVGNRPKASNVQYTPQRQVPVPNTPFIAAPTTPPCTPLVSVAMQSTPLLTPTPASTARSKVFASWVGASGASIQQTNISSGSSVTNDELMQLVRAQQVHKLSIPQLKAILKGKTKISQKKKYIGR
ncbi:Transposable element P transposase [Frankliniella fusca]|uniref:Transposable element P transposase n=1 Tax=Frankliniella fusca TaxID=407009 RepID=A0AAE1HXR8_9NEOP|nr:Transposable element P transposase [Frankliniella fusca]